MKKYSLNKIMTIVLILAALGYHSFSSAKVRAIRARRDFEQNISTKSMVIALFYESEKGNRDTKGLLRMYEDLSAYQPYDDADLIFLKVNVGRNELDDLASLYNVADVPSFIFFNNGKRLIDDKGHAVTLTGFVSRADLQAFIDTYYKTEINARVVEKDIRNEKMVAQENESWKPYFYPRDIFVRDYEPAVTKKNME